MSGDLGAIMTAKDEVLHDLKKIALTLSTLVKACDQLHKDVESLDGKSDK
jgi:hypothetical protein